MFSQNLEERVILNYFGDFKGTLLDAGANDGVTFSNSRQLMLNGWRGYFFEPSGVCADLADLYNGNRKAYIHHCGIGGYTRDEILQESGAHVPNGKDKALVSTIIMQETAKWRGVEFNPLEIRVLGFKEFWERETPTLDFITIDIEGMDWELLQAIDLTAVGCKCLCIEWNSNKALGEQFKSYCTVKHGMRLLHTNAENMIFAL